MTRVKRGVASRKRKKKILKLAKGYKWSRKNRYKLAKEAVMHALYHSYVDRRRKKREFRRLWQIKINAGVRNYNLSYSKFVYGLKKANIDLDRKILAKLADKYPNIFKKIIEKVKSAD